jgi:putative ABC transport system substrate-binding protein
MADCGERAAARDANARFSKQSARSSLPHLLSAFRDGPRELGFVEGENLDIEFRFADGQYDKLPALAAELVRRRVAAIAVASAIATLAAKRATQDIPIVFFQGGDPIKLGFVTSLNRPGANITGASFLTDELVQKRFE